MAIFGDTWRDELITASWRGVEFYIKKSEALVGRKLQVGTHWGTDCALIQDIGQSNDEYAIEGYIIANSGNLFNYFKHRDNLIAALRDGKTTGSNVVYIPTGLFPKNQGGQTKLKTGTLKHPYFGEIEAYLKEPARIEETIEEGGICRFSATFLRVGVPSARLEIKTLGDYIGAVDAAVSDVIAASNDALKTLMVPAAFLNAIGGVMNHIIGGMMGALGSIRGAVASTLKAASKICSNALDAVDSVLDSPCDIASTVGLGIDSILTPCGMAGEIVQGGVVGGCSGVIRGDVFRLDGSSIPEKLTVSSVRLLIDQMTQSLADMGSIPASQEDNCQTILDVAKTKMFVNICRIAIRGDYISKTQSLSVLDLITDALDLFLLDLGLRKYDNSLIVNTIEDLRNIFIKSMRDFSATLVDMVTKTIPADGTNSLSFAYDLYADNGREEEIINLNKLLASHPGFISGGAVLSVLSE